jgi:glucose-1-phosphate thymidylyltransferase
MKVLIPLAGFGTRLRPLTYTRPKPLLNVAGKPVLGHILDALNGLDVEEVTFVIGHLGEQIREYVTRHYRFSARFVEQKELLGQAHALWLAREGIEGPALIIFVDTLFEADLGEIAHLDVDGIIYTKEVEDPRRFGVVRVTGPDQTIVKLIEKPDSLEDRRAVIGVYYVRDGAWLMRAIGDLMAQQRMTRGEYYLADALQVMIDQGAHFVAREVAVWQDCGKPETVLATNRYLLDHGHGNGSNMPLTNAVIIPPVHLGSGVTIEEAVIGPYATVANGAVVRRSVISDSIIGEAALVEDTILTSSLIGDHAVVRGRPRKLNVGDSSQIDFGGAGE